MDLDGYAFGQVKAHVGPFYPVPILICLPYPVSFGKVFR